MRLRASLFLLCFALVALPQDALKERPNVPAETSALRVAPGTHILLNMINSVSTKQAVAGDRISLETAFPVLVNSRIVIPQGSWVTGTITDVKRPARIKGRGTLQVRFDSLTLPNGVTKTFRSDLGAIDPRSDEKLERESSKIQSPGNKKGDTGTVVGASTAGTVIGAGVGGAAGHAGMGGAIGAGAGAAAGLIGVLASRGPDAVLTKGSTVEMVLDRPVTFQSSELDFTHAPPRAALSEGQPPQNSTGSLAPHLPF